VPAPQGAPATQAASAGGELRIETGGTLVLEAAKLEPGRPVVVHLVQGEVSRSDEPNPVRIASVDGRELLLEGHLGDDRKDARLEIDPAFLTPGTYLVEMKTSEYSHFPLRRYVVEVR
jgi:hypothetical protein